MVQTEESMKRARDGSVEDGDIVDVLVSCDELGSVVVFLPCSEPFSSLPMRQAKSWILL